MALPLPLAMVGAIATGALGTGVLDAAFQDTGSDGRKSADLGIGLSFHRNLDEPQCAILLEYIGRLSREWDDNVQISSARTELWDEITNNMFEVDEHGQNTSLKTVCSVFDTRMSRVAFFMELLRAGMIGREFDPERSLLVSRILEAFSFDEDDTLETMLSYLKKERELIGNIEQFMEV